MACEQMTEVQVQEAFLAAPPLVAQQILDLSVKHPNWLRDLYEIEEWPRGNGTVMEQLVFRGAMPQIERGFDKWKKMDNNTGCAPCSTDCSYNWTPFGGNGFERKLTQLMSREFRSPSYCIKEIQTTAHFKEVFAKIVENLYGQVDFFKEMNIGLNFLTGLAKKYVIDSAGAKPNTQNPYVYRPIGNARISTLNVEIFESFYERMRRMPDCVPYDVVDGAPIYSCIASHQLLGRLYRDDPNLRQDARFSGASNDLLTKYNFMSTIRGMFIASPVLYPRRFNYVADNSVGHFEEVLPFVNDVPMEVGAYTGMNELYDDATYEEVILHGKFPFKLFHLPTESSLGANSSFGPEFSWFNSWMWVNPQTTEDPFRRVGYFATSASIGLSAQFSEGMFAILVERPKKTLMASWLPEPECPPEAVECDNEVPVVACPCQMILSVVVNPMDPTHYFVTLASASDAQAEDDIQLGIDTGGYVTAHVEDVSADGTVLEVTFSAEDNGTNPNWTCDHFTTVFCDNTLGCSANIQTYRTDPTDATQVYLALSNPIKAVTPGDVITIYMGDGTSGSATVVSIDWPNNVWLVDVGGTFMDVHGGLVSVCVPYSTDATCPACGGPTVDYCEYPEVQ